MLITLFKAGLLASFGKVVVQKKSKYSGYEIVSCEPVLHVTSGDVCARPVLRKLKIHQLIACLKPVSENRIGLSATCVHRRDHYVKKSKRKPGRGFQQ